MASRILLIALIFLSLAAIVATLNEEIERLEWVQTWRAKWRMADA